MTHHAPLPSQSPLPDRVVTDTHDFAPFIRILGRGPGKSRSLTRPEATLALGMVLRGEAMREQVGAMLMLLRYRGEAHDEMAGLVEAARAHAGLPWVLSKPVDIDWPSYADGRTRGMPWYLLSALLLAKSGLRVLMHGPLSGPGRQPLVETLQRLEIEPSTTRQHAEAALAARNFAYVPLESLSPDLSDLLALRGVLGLRSPLNTVGRLLDPADARGAIDGVFHPAYIDLHLGAATLLGRHVSVIKGGGGEAEWSGAKPVTVHTTGSEKTWPSLAGAGKPDSQTVIDLLAVWAGTKTDCGAEAVLIGTAAIALHATSPELQPETCLERVREFRQNATSSTHATPSHRGL